MKNNKIIAMIVVALGLAFGAYAETVVNLKDISVDTTIGDDTKVKGTLTKKCKISIADGAHVTLSNAKITSVKGDWAGLTCEGSATIVLKGENKIYGCGADYPGIFVPKGKTLTITGDGCLYAYGKESGAGIGGSSTKNCGNIVIEGGEIHAASGETRMSDGSVTVEGGSVHIVAPSSCLSAAGIGGGYKKSCGNIKIKGGKIFADGGESGAGIGSGPSGSCGTIKITGGSVVAVSCSGKVIGGDNCGAVTIGNGIAEVVLIKAGGGGRDDFFSSDYSINGPLTQDGPFDGYGERYEGGIGHQSALIDPSHWRTVRFTSYLGGLKGSTTIKDGEWVTGELTGDYKISIAAGATVVLENVKINSLESDMPGITCLGDATIILQGDNYVKGCGRDYPGIFVPENCNLDIKCVVPGSVPDKIGSLTVVSGGSRGAAIGACWYDLYVNGKSAYEKPCGSINIYDGRITALGGNLAAALGGRFHPSTTSTTVKRHGKQPRIRGGTVSTDGGVKMTSIKVDTGNYWDEVSVSATDDIIISHAVEEASQNGNEQLFRWNGYFNTVDVDTRFLDAWDGIRIYGALTHNAKVTIPPDATVTFTGMAMHWNGVKVGTHADGGAIRRRGNYAGITCEGDATIVLESDTDNLVDVRRPSDPEMFPSWLASDTNHYEDNGYYPAIYVPKNHTLTFDGDGKLLAYGGAKAAGIGAGYGSKRDCGKIVIKNGVIMALGGSSASGIGAGNGSSCQGVTIQSGLTQAFRGKNTSKDPIGVSGGRLEIAENLENKDGPADVFTPVCYSAGSTDTAERHDFYYFAGIDSITSIFSLYNDQRCNLIGMAEDVSRYYHPRTAPKTKALLGAGPHLLGASEWDGNISTIQKHYCDAIAGDGFVLTGTLTDRFKIAIADGARVTLKDLKLGVGLGHDDSSPYAGLTCLGSATLILEGENEITSFHGRYPGIFVPTNAVLHIEGPGSLVASSAGYGAGIGGGYELDCGMIYVSGGFVTANGGKYAAGIGGGYRASCIGVSIGSGIGQVRAYSGQGGGQPIGNGYEGTCAVPSIGRGLYDVTIDNLRTLHWNGNLSSINDSMATVTAFDETSIVGTLGSDCRCKVQIAPGAHVTLANARINSSLSNAAFTGDTAPWAGITCLGDATITLLGNNSVSSFNKDYPCIYVPRGSTLTVKGGGTDTLQVRNTASGARGAGIGGGENLGCGKIVIDGGNVTAESTGYAAAIGGGYGAYCEGVEIRSGVKLLDAQVPYVASAQTANDAAPVGRGGAGTCAYVRVSEGVNVVDTGTWTHARYVANPNIDLSTVTSDARITVDAVVTGTLEGSHEITIAPGAWFTLKDACINGSTAGLRCEGSATIFLEGTNYICGSAGWPGIYVPADSTLHILSQSEDGGYLEVVGGSNSAGIGSGNLTGNRKCGAILIDGGVISATGKGNGAGIGAAGSSSTCDGIIINYGTVTASGPYAGIGRGRYGSCEGIYIRDGIAKVTAVNGITTADTVEIDTKLRDTTVGNTRTLSFNPDFDLQNVYNAVVATNTATITGRCINQEKKISIAAGATVTLSNVTIRGVNKSSCEWAGITCEGDATIILVGTNTVTGFDSEYPGIYVPAYATLTIKGDGSLDASSNGYGAGIGAGWDFKYCGNIVIESGSIVATGGYGAAGIGGGHRSSCGDITIKGGIVAATGGKGAAGIGCGDVAGACGKITIGDKVKVITAVGGQDDGAGKGEAIGASCYSSPKGLSVSGSLVDLSEEGDPVNKRTLMAKTIDLGTVVSDVTLLNGVTARGTLAARHKVSIAAGATVTLDSAVISFASKSGSTWAGLTCIGDATIVLKGTSTVKGFYQGYPGILVPTNSTLVIEGSGTLNASCSDDGFPDAAGIGGGSGAACGRIVINSGTVTATGHSAAGIGSCSTGFEGIEINGGIVTATGSAGGAGIGAGVSNSSCGDIVINGGVVTATAEGESSGAGIGGGRYGRGVNVTIGPGVERVVATSTDGDPIGKGNWSQGAAPVVTVDESLVDTTSGSTRTISHPVVVDLSTVTGDMVLENGMIASGTLGGARKVSIAAGAAVTLRDLDINGAEGWTNYWAGITCLGDATITLEGSSTVKSFSDQYPGIYIPQGYTLTIRGNGSLAASALKAYGFCGSAGIGGGFKQDQDVRFAGNIVIESGTITATGGGMLTSSIGSGCLGSCGDITINGGITRVACTSADSFLTYGAEYIGRGASNKVTSSSCGTVVIDPGLYQKTSTSSLVISSWDGNLAELDHDVVVEDGMTLYGTLQGNYKVSITNGATVTLLDAVINLPQDQGCEWAGLTCLGDARIVLDGENVVRGSHLYYPGIHVPVGSTLTIAGDGVLTASSNGRGAGIGGGWNISCGNIVIAGGTINATGGSNCAGIGGGYPKNISVSCGDVTIGSGIAKVVATGGAAADGASDPAPVGAGSGCTCGTITIAPLLLDVTSGRRRTFMSAPTYEEWVAEQNLVGAGIVGAWDARDAKGVANVSRYVFDKALDADFDESKILIGFETDGEGRVAIQTLPVVNGQGLFNLTIVASDNVDGTGYVMEYPLTPDEGGVTIIDEVYNPSRFFRVKIDLAR